jgi:hypothetical protein
MFPERFNVQDDGFSYVCGDFLNGRPRRDTTRQIRDARGKVLLVRPPSVPAP